MLENNKNAVTVIYSGGDIQVPFLFYDAADLVVLYEITPKILGTDYTVTGAGNEVGGKITLIVPPADGTRVTVLRKVDFTQMLRVPANGILPEGALNRALDRIVMMIQQLAEQAERAVTYPEGTEKGEVANAQEMLDSIEKARTDINNAVNVAGTTLDTANEKLGEINTVSSATLQEIAEQQQRNEESVTKAEDAAARAQSLPLGHVIHGFWKTAPAGTLALRMAQWPIASFPDLFQMAVDAGIAVPKGTYDAIMLDKGSVGFFGIDADGVSFWTPHLEDIAVAPASPGMAGFETGDINLASLPEIAFTSDDIFRGADATSDPKYTGGLYPYGRERNGAAAHSSATPKATGIGFKASLCDDTYNRDGDSEVRTKRMHILFCVVAYHEARPAAVADMAALLASITQLQADVQELQADIQKKMGIDNYALFVDERATGVNGGTSPAGWSVRPLNTEVYNSIAGAELNPSTFEVTLEAGTYYARISAVVYKSQRVTIRLFDSTHNTVLVGSINEYSRGDAYSDSVCPVGYGMFTLTETSVISLQQCAEASATSQGYGISNNFLDVPERYALAEFWRFA